MGLQFTGFTTVTIQHHIYVLYGAFGILFSQIIDAMLHLHGQIVLSSKLLRSVTSTEVGHIKYASSRWSLNFQYHQRFAKLAKRGRALSHCLSLSLVTMINPNPLKMMMRDRRCFSVHRLWCRNTANTALCRVCFYCQVTWAISIHTHVRDYYIQCGRQRQCCARDPFSLLRE